MDEYGEFYQIDALDDWINGAYTEDGDEALCSACGEPMRYDEENFMYVCPGCGYFLNRTDYFSHIGANPPGSICISQCKENYPVCKKWCVDYDIDPDDPMLP